MKFEKLFYIIASTVLITTFILIGYISSVYNTHYKESTIKKIYYVDNITNAHQKIIDIFNKKYKGQIEVIPINTPFEKFSTNERKELLARYLRSKSDRIDVFAVDQIWVPRFAKWCIPLEKFTTSKVKKGILPFAMESCVYKDTLVALPIYIDIATLIYREDKLKTLPDFKSWQKKLQESITWDEFIKLSSEMNKNNPFYLFAADDFEGLICTFTEMMASMNKPLIENNRLNFNTSEAQRSIQLLIDLIYKYKMSPREVCQFRENPSYDYYIKNNGVFLRSWSAFPVTYSSKLKSPDAKLTIVPTPHFQNGRSTSVFGGWNLMISKYSGKAAESMLFINFVNSPEAQKILYEDGGLLPINNEIYSDSNYVATHKDLRFYYTLMQNGFHRPYLENYTSVSDILSYYLNLALLQKISVKEALINAEKKIHSADIF
jgi:multiple sugar transport system substrate-binding protein